MSFHGDVAFCSANKVEVRIVVSRLNAWAHRHLYGGGWTLEALLQGNVDFRSTNEGEMLIRAGSVLDAHVVEDVFVSMSEFEILLHSCNSNWRQFSEGHTYV
jgi:hypothetical protein